MINIDIFDTEDKAGTAAQVYRTLGREASVYQAGPTLIADRRNNKKLLDEAAASWIVVASEAGD